MKNLRPILRSSIASLVNLVLIGLCIGCMPGKKSAELTPVSIADCDSMLTVLNSIIPGFDEKWKADSMGCDGFRAERVSMNSHQVLKGSSLVCVLEILGKPNSLAKSKTGTSLTYILFNRDCERRLPNQQLIIGFSKNDILDNFGLIIE